jgi:hypothetical protein
MYEEGAGFGCGIRQRAVHAWPWLSQVSRAEELNGEPRPEARPDMLIDGPLGEIQLFQKNQICSKLNQFKIGLCELEKYQIK